MILAIAEDFLANRIEMSERTSKHATLDQLEHVSQNLKLQAAAGFRFRSMLDALGPPCLSSIVGQVRAMCRHYILGCTAAALLMGCAHSIRLKMVDATTHEPLEGVAVQWVQARHQMFQQLKQEGPTNLLRPLGFT